MYCLIYIYICIYIYIYSYLNKWYRFVLAKTVCFFIDACISPMGCWAFSLDVASGAHHQHHYRIMTFINSQLLQSVSWTSSLSLDSFVANNMIINISHHLNSAYSQECIWQVTVTTSSLFNVWFKKVIHNRDHPHHLHYHQWQEHTSCPWGLVARLWSPVRRTPSPLQIGLWSNIWRCTLADGQV